MADAGTSPHNVLHVFPSFGFGGQQARFASLAPSLGGAFYHHVVALDGDLAARALIPSSAPVRYRSFDAKKSSVFSLANISGLRKLIRETEARVLCTYNWGAIEAVIANRFGAGLSHLHFEDGFGPGESTDNQPMRRVLARKLLLSNSKVVVPSRTLETAAKTVWGLREVKYLQNGIDISRFAAAGTRVNGAAVKVGTVGALRAEKNYSRLIRAFDQASPLEAQLLIYGEGPDENMLQALAQETVAAKRISFPGATERPEEAYAAFDLFALSSDTEQAPLTVMEAMAAGLPVIATDVGDISKMVSVENRKFITPLGDDEAYAKSLSMLVADVELRQKLGAANMEKAYSEFALERMVSEHRALYEQAIAG